jgi:hypothetical protein
MDESEQTHLAKIREAMASPDVSLHPARTFTHGLGVQVYVKNLKVGPILFPVEGQSIADVLHMLGTMMTDEESGEEPEE